MSHRIAIVEDDPHNATLFRKILEKRLGCSVTLTESAEELLELARTGKVDLVVLDVSLGHTTWEGRSVSGIEICRVLKADPRAAHVPVMLATAHAMRGDAQRLLAESGADDYVAKPIVDHAAFVEQVRALMEHAA